MTVDLDDTDWLLLELLQADARMPWSELGRRVSMSAPAVTERVRRLEERGILRGYGARVDLAALGVPVEAVVRVSTATSDYGPVRRKMEQRPEILECQHVTGEDCLVVRVACRSMVHLEETVGFLADLGSTTTSVVFSALIDRRAVRRGLVDPGR